MKNVVITLLAQKPEELSRFLKSYYQEEIIMEEGAFRWSCYFANLRDCMSLLATVVDNSDKFRIEPLLTLDKTTTLKITTENINDIIRLFIWQ